MQAQEIKNRKIYLSEVNSVWREVLHLGKREEVAKGESWYSVEKKDVISFIDKGLLRMECSTNTGKQRSVLYLQAGCIIQEIGILSGGSMHNFITVVEDSTIFHFPAEIIQDTDFMYKYPYLLRNLLVSIAEKANIFFCLLADANEGEPFCAICRYFEKLAENNDANIFTPNLSQVDIAAHLGLHRSTICKALRRLREEKIIGSFTRKKLEILDRKKLQQYC